MDFALYCVLPLIVLGLAAWGWQRLRAKKSSMAAKAGRGGLILDVVGESQYQANLQRLCGKRKADGEDRWFEQAALVAEPDNPADPNAVRVEIQGKPVGYLSRHDAAAIADIVQAKPVAVRAHVRGGWYDPDGDHGNYGVRIEM